MGKNGDRNQEAWYVRKTIKLILFRVSLFAGGLVLLLLAGLVPQDRVQANVRESVDQIAPKFE